jgi:hypothetical protein
MRSDIRFAGIALEWTKEYAARYAAKLKEMGYCIRLAEAKSHLIAYSHRSFTTSEMEECLAALLEGKE